MSRRKPGTKRRPTILQAIVALAHDLGLTIVAEGIEDQSQVDRLVELECDYGQGFFIGQPMTAKQVGESLTSVPYVKGHGRTAMSTLWERAAEEPPPVAVETELTVNAIEKAESQRSSEWQAVKEAALANLAEKPAVLSPPPGSSPMAPRLARPQPEELPTIPVFAEKPATAPKKRKSAKRKKIPRLKAPKLQAWPDSGDSIRGSTPIFLRARPYFPSLSVPKMRSSSASQCSQPLCWISLSSCPATQPE